VPHIDYSDEAIQYEKKLVQVNDAYVLVAYLILTSLRYFTFYFCLFFLRRNAAIALHIVYR